MPNSVETKKKELAKYGITVLDGTYDNIYLKYLNKVTITYSTTDFIFFSTQLLMSDVLIKLDLDKSNLIWDNTFDGKLKKKKDFLEASNIKKFWIENNFYLSKNGVDILYSFDDYIDFEPVVFIADVRCAFNRLDVADMFKEERKTYDEYLDDIINTVKPFVKTINTDDDIILKKKNIRKIMVERGIIV